MNQYFVTNKPDKPVKMIFVGDLHKCSRERTTAEYTDIINDTQMRLFKLLKDKQIDRLFLLGDWYDARYSYTDAGILQDYDMDIVLSNIMRKDLKGQVYGFEGNHYYTNPPYNLEKHLYERGIFSKMLTSIRIGDVQISAVPYEPGNITAHPKRENWAKKHIALFHTENIVPIEYLHSTEYENRKTVSETDTDIILSGVDIAIDGHIHKSLGTIRHNDTTIVIPGSLSNTDLGDDLHDKIQIPVITTDGESVKLDYIPFDIPVPSAEPFRTEAK